MKFAKYFFIVVGVILLTLVAIGIFKTDYQSKASVEIEAPQHQAFAVYNNPLLYKRWMTNYQGFEQLEGQLNDIGNKHRLKFTTGSGEITTLDQTLAEFTPNELISYNYQNQWLEGTSTATFTDTGNGTTRIDLRLDYTGRGIVQNSLLFLLSSTIDQGHQYNLEQLKSLIEESKPEELEYSAE
ncbi:SRPBCC family protein [Kangiella taiwanensis]|uniref:Polyketide cyclase n=1 Tax=Kangiella taiwanensis TaxID=1079179 RepID=A0ABP8HUM5_9GAMM|nr:SRPBCC family protein [Kangiella taiwanensis]